MPGRSTLAHLLQFTTFAVLAASGAWLAIVWSHSPWAAVLGALAILFTHAWLLAVEFLVLPWVARGDPAPPARLRERARAWAAETWMAIRIFSWRQPFAWRDEPDVTDGHALAGRVGVVFIHGFVCNRGFWTPWLRRARALGHPFIAVNLEPVFGELDNYVSCVAAAVRQMRHATGVAPVLVCHSMGGLVARAYLRTVDHLEEVSHVVSIAAPHHGAWVARFSQMPNGRQMRIGNPWLTTLARSWSQGLASRFTCWYSNCDNVVMPPSSATLAGAENRLVRGAGHTDLAFKEEVLRETFALLEAIEAVTRAAGRRAFS